MPQDTIKLRLKCITSEREVQWKHIEVPPEASAIQYLRTERLYRSGTVFHNDNNIDTPTRCSFQRLGIQNDDVLEIRNYVPPMIEKFTVSVMVSGVQHQLQTTLPITVKDLKAAIEAKTCQPSSHLYLLNGDTEWNCTDEFICTAEDLKELKVVFRPTLEAQGVFKSFPVTYSPQLSTDTESGGSSTDLGGPICQETKSSAQGISSLCTATSCADEEAIMKECVPNKSPPILQANLRQRGQYVPPWTGERDNRVFPQIVRSPNLSKITESVMGSTEDFEEQKTTKVPDLPPLPGLTTITSRQRPTKPQQSPDSTLPKLRKLGHRRRKSCTGEIKITEASRREDRQQWQSGSEETSARLAQIPEPTWKQHKRQQSWTSGASLTFTTNQSKDHRKPPEHLRRGSWAHPVVATANNRTGKRRSKQPQEERLSSSLNLSLFKEMKEKWCS